MYGWAVDIGYWDAFVYFVCCKFRWKSVCLARMRHTHTHAHTLDRCSHTKIWFCTFVHKVKVSSSPPQYAFHSRFLFYDIIDANLELYIIVFAFKNWNLVAGAEHIHLHFRFLNANAAHLYLILCQAKWMASHADESSMTSLHRISFWLVNTKHSFRVHSQHMCVCGAHLFSHLLLPPIRLGPNAFENFASAESDYVRLCADFQFIFFFCFCCSGEAKNLRK